MIIMIMISMIIMIIMAIMIIMTIMIMDADIQSIDVRVHVKGRTENIFHKF